MCAHGSSTEVPVVALLSVCRHSEQFCSTSTIITTVKNNVAVWFSSKSSSVVNSKLYCGIAQPWGEHCVMTSVLAVVVAKPVTTGESPDGERGRVGHVCSVSGIDRRSRYDSCCENEGKNKFGCRKHHLWSSLARRYLRKGLTVLTIVMSAFFWFSQCGMIAKKCETRFRKLK